MFPLPWRNPWPIVRNRKDDGSAFLPQGDRDQAARIPPGILQDVPHRPCELVLVARHLPGRNAARLHANGIRREHTPHFAQYDVVEVHRQERCRRRALICPREQQQVVHKPLHAFHLLQRAPHGRLPVRLRRVRHVHFELGANARQRATQLVRSVRHERPLLIRGSLQARQHAVHRPRETADLIVHLRFRNAPLQVLQGDLRDLPADAFDRPQRPPNDQPTGERYERCEDWESQ